IKNNMNITTAVSDIAVDPTNPNHAVATVSTYTSENTWYTNNGDSTWTAASTGLPQVPAMAAVMLTNPYRIYIGTDVGVFKATSDAGLYVPDMNGMPQGVPVHELEYSSVTGTMTAGT